MNLRNLGSSDIKVSSLALGCWVFGKEPVWGPQEDSDSINTIHAALDAGITLLDTAEAYGDGHSEVVVGKALAGRRDRAILASKVFEANLRPADVRKACEGSLTRLKTDYIDLYQIHWPNPAIPLADTVGELEKLRSEGKIRQIGISNFGERDLHEFLQIGQCVSNQLPYNLLWRAIEYVIQPLCVANDISILTYSPLLHGLLTGKFRTAGETPVGRSRTRHFAHTRPQTRHGEAGFEAETFAAIDRIRQISADLDHSMAQLALAWLLHRPGVTSVIVGARKPDQIERNRRAAELTLTGETIQALDAATADLKEKLGPGADPWETPSRIR